MTISGAYNAINEASISGQRWARYGFSNDTADAWAGSLSFANGALGLSPAIGLKGAVGPSVELVKDTVSAVRAPISHTAAYLRAKGVPDWNILPLEYTPGTLYSNPLPVRLERVVPGGVELGGSVANSAGRLSAYSGDVYASDFVGPVKWKYFYRGDATLRTDFLSSMAQERGVAATTEFLNTRSTSQLSEIYADHGLGSQGLPTIGVSDNPAVAEYFARGPSQKQSGVVTMFRLESRDAANAAIPNYENPHAWFGSNPINGLDEREYLFHTLIDPKYIYQQLPVVPK
ncbi:hypothetical protein HNQ59_003990 [Chitinivorax tropicus]|uniref:Uncharacterized protein n=2 Tax=Chitinivorax tropicus TaxID=714531 RepID=A0A840MTD3_9PROT|nr:hypothetical protein [Chitinivorax tropicus]